MEHKIEEFRIISQLAAQEARFLHGMSVVLG